MMTPPTNAESIERIGLVSGVYLHTHPSKSDEHGLHVLNQPVSASRS